MTELTDPTEEQVRPEPPLAAGEIETVRGFLAYQRATFGWKTSGLDDEQFRVRLAPSSMSLGGMMKHLARVEDSWFAEVVGEAPELDPWASAPKEDPDWEWHSAEEDSAASIRAQWAASIQRSDAVVERVLAGDPEAGWAAVHPAWDNQGRVSTRWVVVHMVEEYARHNGQADLIRESIDGLTGE